MIIIINAFDGNHLAFATLLTTVTYNYFDKILNPPALTYHIITSPYISQSPYHSQNLECYIYIQIIRVKFFTKKQRNNYVILSSGWKFIYNYYTKKNKLGQPIPKITPRSTTAAKSSLPRSNLKREKKFSHVSHYLFFYPREAYVIKE